MTKTKTDFPFVDFDVSEFLSTFTAPNVDMAAMFESQRKTYQAVAAAQQRAAEGFQALATRQAAIVREAMDEAQGATKGLFDAKAPEANVAKRTELAKKQLEGAVKHARELTDMATKSQAEVFDVLNQRFLEAFDEVRDQFAATRR